MKEHWNLIKVHESNVAIWRKMRIYVLGYFFLGYWWLMILVNVKQTIRKHLDGNAGKLYVNEFSQNNKSKSELMSRMFAEWKVIVIFVIVFEPFSWLLNSSEPSSLNGVKYITKWDLKYSISCYMLISEGLNMQTYWTTANYKSIRFIVIYCVLISTNVQFSDQNALHDSNQVLPCNRFFFSLRDLTVLHPKTFDSQSFIRPISLSVGKGQRPGFSEGLFIGSEQQTGCK